MESPSLNRAQRIVIVIGLGLALYLLGGWLTTLGTRPLVGWTGYAPLSTVNVFGGIHPWLRLVIWFLLIALWVGSSLGLLRRGSSGTRE